MLIRPHSPIALSQQQLALSVLLKQKANFIKNQKFRISLYDNVPHHPRETSTMDSGNFVTMFKSITKQIKSKIKEDKRANEHEKTANNQTTILGTHISPQYNQVQNLSYKTSDHCSKNVKTMSSQQRLSYSNAEFSLKPKINRRKMTSTNYSQKICKGSTFSRLTNVERKASQPLTKTKIKTEAEAQYGADEDFIPLGQIHVGNNSYTYLKDVKQSAQAQSWNISQPQEEPMKQIYDKIFVKFPNPQGEGRRKSRRNMRKLYSSYKMSCDKKIDKSGENDSRKYNFASNKIMKPSQPELSHTFRKQSVPGGTFGPWVEQRFY